LVDPEPNSAVRAASGPPLVGHLFDTTGLETSIRRCFMGLSRHIYARVGPDRCLGLGSGEPRGDNHGVSARMGWGGMEAERLNSLATRR
jgi:hypothetical protein